MNDDQFTELFKYMTERFDGVEKKLEKHDVHFDRIESPIDQVLKQQAISDDEILVMGHQLERLYQ